ncbi:MAG: SH3 domain-containing protein [Anaerolineae bacterium]
MKRFIQSLLMVSTLLLIGTITLFPALPAQAQANVPWSGIFYSQNDFSGTSQIVTYPNGLSQNWGTGAPVNPATGQILAGIPADNFSARFTANTTIQANLYEFIVVVDGGIRLTINGEVVIDDLANTGFRRYSRIVNLANGPYLIVADYVEYTGDALIQVNWIVSDGTPTEEDSGTPPIAVGEVVQVRGLSLRSGPFLGGTLLGVARPGTSYPIISRNTQEGLFTWYLIQFDADTQGWVSGRYFAITAGNQEDIPLIEASAFITVYDPPGIVRGVTRSNMNFRTLPTERSARLADIPQLDWGAQVEILARTRQGGQDFWYQVRYNPSNSSNSYVGWIFAPFVDIIAGSDPIDTVPRL